MNVVARPIRASALQRQASLLRLATTDALAAAIPAPTRAAATVAGSALYFAPCARVHPGPCTSLYPGSGSTWFAPPLAASEPAGAFCLQAGPFPSGRPTTTPGAVQVTDGRHAPNGWASVGACPYPRHAQIVGVTAGSVNGETDAAQDAGFTRLSQFGTDAFDINPPARICFGGMLRGVKQDGSAYRAKDLHLSRRSQNFRGCPDQSDDSDAAAQGGYCPAGRGEIVRQSQPHAGPQGGQHGLSRHAGGGGFRHAAPSRPGEVERLDRRGSGGRAGIASVLTRKGIQR